MKKIIALIAILISFPAFAANYWIPQDAIVGGSSTINLLDDIDLSFGTGATMKCRWETADANANSFVCVTPEGGSTDVPGDIFGDVTVDGTDLGFFNGITAPFRAVISDDGLSYVYMAHDETNSIFRTNEGAFDFNASLFLGDNLGLLLGNTAAVPDTSIGWNTTQTVDSLYIGVPAAGRAVLIGEEEDKGFNSTIANPTNPSLCGKSSVQSTTQYWCLTHDQTDSVLSTAAGGIKLQTSDSTYLHQRANALLQLIGASGGKFITQFATDTVGGNFQSKITNSTTVPSFEFSNIPTSASNSFNASAGTQIHTKITAVQNQSGTAGLDVVVSDLTPTSQGSAEDTLFKGNTSGNTKFKVDSAGTVTAEGFYSNEVQTVTVADNSTPITPATFTLTPTSSYITVDCNDSDGCTATMGETGMVDGHTIEIFCLDASLNTGFSDSSGVSELAGAFTCGQYDSIRMRYVSDRWIEVARSNN